MRGCGGVWGVWCGGCGVGVWVGGIWYEMAFFMGILTESLTRVGYIMSATVTVTQQRQSWPAQNI